MCPDLGPGHHHHYRQLRPCDRRRRRRRRKSPPTPCLAWESSCWRVQSL